eukprot:CAMPEP_0201509452 /NCGR_PEP_ID=MMETSP0161_2-20130828/2494_1 /ASSEMBLY_ACC=CAM_ASM_000251 /TAXON_ID=180227 /ORGANISM="Neoparamoeba aestuarina, Strain SoJaBio B1-5/56/2" /LENGTH=332 /DNA_ID=CAMNT_0047904403 /DNA_START=56 /DNA_END=1054 /DNA_ORIENTATION=+
MAGHEVHLIIKSPSVQAQDFHLPQTPTWLTISELKEQLSSSFTTQPPVTAQRLIYGGKILQDNMSVGEVLAQRDLSTPQVFHLVISKQQPSAPEPQPQPFEPQQPPQPQQPQPPPYPQQPQPPPFGQQQPYYGGQPQYPYHQPHQHQQPVHAAFAAQYAQQLAQQMAQMQQQHFQHHQQQHQQQQQQPQQQHPQQRHGEDLFLLLKLIVFVFLFNQGGSEERLFLMSLGALLYYLYQTGRLNFFHVQFNFNNGLNNAQEQQPNQPQDPNQPEQQQPQQQPPQPQQPPGFLQNIGNIVLHFFLSLLPTYVPVVHQQPPPPQQQPQPPPEQAQQ